MKKLPVNTIICNDAVEEMLNLPFQSVDMVFTSPPYNTGGKGKNEGMYQDYSDNLTDEEYLTLLNRATTQMIRVCKGAVFVNINYMNNNKNVIFQWVADNSKNLREVIVWKKNNIQPPIGNILAKRYEFIYMFSRDPKFEVNTFKYNKARRYTRQFGSWISNLIELKTDSTEYSQLHRALFPVALPQIFIDIYTEIGDIVLDPFAGLCTTAVASKELDRQYIAIEINPKYCEVGSGRVAQEVLKL